MGYVVVICWSIKVTPFAHRFPVPPHCVWGRRHVQSCTHSPLQPNSCYQRAVTWWMLASVAWNAISGATYDTLHATTESPTPEHTVGHLWFPETGLTLACSEVELTHPSRTTEIGRIIAQPHFRYVNNIQIDAVWHLSTQGSIRSRAYDVAAESAWLKWHNVTN